MNQHQQGAVMLFTVLILASAGLTALLALARVGIGQVVDVQSQTNALIVRESLFGCIDELLGQFSGDSSYAPVLIDTGDVQCSVSVISPAPELREADVFVTNGSITRRVHVEFRVDPVVVTEIVEL